MFQSSVRESGAKHKYDVAAGLVQTQTAADIAEMRRISTLVRFYGETTLTSV